MQILLKQTEIPRLARSNREKMLRVPSRAFRLLPTSLPAGLAFDVAENKQQQLEAVEKLNEIVDWATNGGSDKAKELVELYRF